MILLYRGISPLSRTIRFRTRVISWLPPSCDYSHVAWELDDASVIEAWKKGGVRHVPTFAADHTPGTSVDVFEVRCPRPHLRTNIELFLLSQVGKRYDTAGILGFVARQDNMQRKDRWFCSELIASAFSRSKMPLLARLEPHRMLPGMIVLSPFLERVETRICRSRIQPEPVGSLLTPCTP